MTPNQNERHDETVEHDCPNCGEETAFSSGKFGLSCDRCGYTPRRSVREEIRNAE